LSKYIDSIGFLDCR